MTDGPLTVLARKLTAGPPSLAQLIALLDQGEDVQEFVRLVREFLPDWEHEILSLGTSERMQAFCQHFEERYFPLEDVMLEDAEYGYLVFGIPIVRRGLSYDEYHEFQDFSMAYQLLMALVQYPYTDAEQDEGVSARIPLLEQCAKYVGEALVKRIEPAGWSPETLHRLLDGTRFEGAALLADWVWQQTGTGFLDLTDEDGGYDPISWDRENVELLTQEHHRANQIMNEIGAVVNWLEDAPQANFKQLLDEIGVVNQVPKEQIPLPLGDSDDDK